MSLEFQEGWMLEAESGESLHGDCTEPPGPDGFSRAVFPKEHLEIQGIVFRLHSDWGMLPPSGRK